jgi:predicted  nucleic acid-binding Zn-ribbon protein
MEETHRALLALQDLDGRLAGAQERLQTFDPQLEELRAPVAELERERDAARAELVRMRDEVQRMERNAGRNRERLAGYEARLGKGRPDEATTRAEIDLISRAVDADVEEAAELSRQITRAELKVDELGEKLAAAEAEIRPRQDEVTAARTELEEEIALLRQQRENLAVRVDPATLRLYDRVRAGRSRSALAPLTLDGACGHCFNVVPVQRQSEIRRGVTLQRCEACGVILYPGQ